MWSGWRLKWNDIIGTCSVGNKETHMLSTVRTSTPPIPALPAYICTSKRQLQQTWTDKGISNSCCQSVLLLRPLHECAALTITVKLDKQIKL
jgi:hypothetical protein